MLKALEMASLPTNESTVAMTKQLMDAGFPIDKILCSRSGMRAMCFRKRQSKIS